MYTKTIAGTCTSESGASLLSCDVIDGPVEQRFQPDSVLVDGGAKIAYASTNPRPSPGVSAGP
jgi:hypothetical protein